MVVHLKDFWTKHPIEGELSTALEMIYDRICWAKEKYHAGDQEYMKDMCHAYSMLEDIFIEMGITPQELV